MDMWSDDSDFEDVPAYRNSSETEESESSSAQQQQQVTVSRRKSLQWNFVQKFNDLVAAKQMIQQQNEFVYRQVKKLKEENKLEYDCRLFRLWKCPAKMKLTCPHTSMEVFMYRDETPHKHDEYQGKPQVTPEQKAAIESIVIRNRITRPKLVNRELRMSELSTVKSGTLSTHIKRIKLSLNPRINTYGDLVGWCRRQPTITPETMETIGLDIPAIVCHQILESEERKFIRVLVSTKRLLLLGPKVKLVCTDSTYKLNWMGFPTLIVGTTDMEKKFHGLGIAVCSEETGEDFAFIFRELKRGIELVSQTPFSPHVLLADSADAITIGYRAVFGEPANFKRVNCWFHVKKNIKNVIGSNIKDDEDKEKFNSDLQILQLSSNEIIFRKGFELLYIKWARKYPELMKYIQSNWIEKRYGWFEGFAPSFPSTNNALESINSTIKLEHTLREKLDCGTYMNNLLQIVQEWSNDRNAENNPEPKEFADCPALSTSVMDLAFKWQSAAALQHRTKDNFIEYVVGAGNNPHNLLLHSERQQKRRELSWVDFDDFVRLETCLWKVKIPVEMPSWKKSVCNCPVFQKNYICKHIVGVCFRLNCLRVPPEIKSLPIGKKRARGRPKKNSTALSTE